MNQHLGANLVAQIVVAILAPEDGSSSRLEIRKGETTGPDAGASIRSSPARGDPGIPDADSSRTSSNTASSWSSVMPFASTCWRGGASARLTSHCGNGSGDREQVRTRPVCRLRDRMRANEAASRTSRCLSPVARAWSRGTASLARDRTRPRRAASHRVYSDRESRALSSPGPHRHSAVWRPPPDRPPHRSTAPAARSPPPYRSTRPGGSAGPARSARVEPGESIGGHRPPSSESRRRPLRLTPGPPPRFAVTGHDSAQCPGGLAGRSQPRGRSGPGSSRGSTDSLNIPTHRDHSAAEPQAIRRDSPQRHRDHREESFDAVAFNTTPCDVVKSCTAYKTLEVSRAENDHEWPRRTNSPREDPSRMIARKSLHRLNFHSALYY